MSLAQRAVVILGFLASAAAAETQTADLATYRVPDGWTREEKARTSVSHTQIDQKNGRWCQLYAWLSMASAGTLDADFTGEWDTLVGKNFGSVAPTPRKAKAPKGWQVKAASAAFDTKAGKNWIYLHTYSNGQQRMTFTAVTNQPKNYGKTIDAFFASIALTAAAPPAGDASTAKPPVATTTATPTGTGKTTNFDDGWVAVEQADWVQATKEGLTVRIHYARPDIRAFNNLDEATAFVWNQLVVPRYTQLTNVWIRRPFWSDGDTFHGKYFAEADARDGNGTQVHVALFKDGTYGRWIEVVTPDRATFQKRVTTVVKEDGTSWDPLVKLGNYNKFAVTAADLVGSWASASGAAVQYYEVYTGNNAGMAYASSTNDYVFRKDGTYTSVYKGAQNLQDGRGTQFSGETLKGSFKVTNWELTVTNRFKGATHTFAISFEAVKGGRILHMYRGTIEEVHLFKKP